MPSPIYLIPEERPQGASRRTHNVHAAFSSICGRPVTSPVCNSPKIPDEFILNHIGVYESDRFRTPPPRPPRVECRPHKKKVCGCQQRIASTPASLPPETGPPGQRSTAANAAGDRGTRESPSPSARFFQRPRQRPRSPSGPLSVFPAPFPGVVPDPIYTGRPGGPAGLTLSKPWSPIVRRAGRTRPHAGLSKRAAACKIAAIRGFGGEQPASYSV
jgi:hypothetical protein